MKHKKTRKHRIKESVDLEPVTKKSSIQVHKTEKETTVQVANPFKDEQLEWKVHESFKELTPRDAMKILSEQNHLFGVDVYFVDDLEAPKVKLLGVRYFEEMPFFMKDDEGSFVASHCFLKLNTKG
jgi:hypothetical protein